MKSIALSGTRGNVSGIPFMTTQAAMQRAGNNCGNLVFQYAVTNLVNEPVKVIGEDLPWDKKSLQENCRSMVIPSANFLREGLDFTGYVNFLEQSNLPLTFIGLGAQADDFNKKEFDFHPSVLRLIDLIKERCKKVSIRGEFTARVLERFGITNYEITGCPSNFINQAPDFPEMIARKLQAPMRSFITHADEPWPKKDIKKQTERRLVEWTRNGRAVMVQQAVPRMIDYLRQNNPFAAPEVGPNFEASLAKTLMPGASMDEFAEFIAVKMRTYYSVEQWLEDSSRFDFSIGLRLHGNMAAWQSGTPALWITHDSRTQELSDTMGLPNIGIEDFLENCATIEDAWERVEFDPEAYRQRRALLKSRLDSVLQAADIPVRPLSHSPSQSSL